MKKVSKIFSLLDKKWKEFFLIQKNYGSSFALYGFVWWLCFYFRTPLSFWLSSWAIKKKTAWLDRYIEYKYADVLSSFKANPPRPQTVSDHRIWVFWGQGEAAMPPLIRICYQQLKRNHENVTLLTCENVGKYITLSPVIFEKVKTGVITWTHFSDIVRNTLLAQHGGLWLDATVWVPLKLPVEKLLQMPLFTASGTFTPSLRTLCFWTSLQWSWSSWCLWAKDKNYLLFSFVSTMLQKFAQVETVFPDYVLQDYLIYYACCHFPSVAKDMEKCREVPCEYRNELAAIMAQPYDEERYRELIKTDFIFKLSFRSAWEKEKNGLPTFYGKFIAGEL